VKVKHPLQAYFRIDAENFGQFERTLIIADEGSEVMYMEGCTAPKFETSTLHSAVVELVAMKGAKIQYITRPELVRRMSSTLSPSAGMAHEEAEIKWIDCNIGSRLTMKYPGVIMKGRNARGEVISIALAGNGQHQDTGAKMVHAARRHDARTSSPRALASAKAAPPTAGSSRSEAPSQGLQEQHRVRRAAHQHNSRTDTYPAITVYGDRNACAARGQRVSKVSAENRSSTCSSEGSPKAAGDEPRASTDSSNDLVRQFPMEYSRRTQTPHRPRNGGIRRLTSGRIYCEHEHNSYGKRSGDVGMAGFGLTGRPRSATTRRPPRRSARTSRGGCQHRGSRSFRIRSAAPVTSEGRIIVASRGLEKVSARLVFGNNSLLHEEKAALPEGVVLTTLELATRDHEALFERFFMAQPVELGSHKYAALHKARVSTGAFLYVPPNTEVALPIEIFHWVEGALASVFPHTLVICGENSRVTVVDRFQSIDGNARRSPAVSTTFTSAGSQAHLHRRADWSHDSLAFHLNSTIVEKDALCTALTANFGGGFVRGESLSRLVGERGESECIRSIPSKENGRSTSGRFRTMSPRTPPATCST